MLCLQKITKLSLRAGSIAVAGFAIIVLVAACSSKLHIQTGALNNHIPSIATAPINVYQRIAHQAARCWFAPGTLMHKTHIFHAIAAPPSDGGSVQISIHKRLPNIKKPWGARTYLIQLDGVNITAITFRNISLDIPTQNFVKKDVLAWAHNEQQCSPQIAPEPKPSTINPPPIN